MISVLHICMYALAFVLPFGNLLRIRSFSGVSILPVDVVVGFIAIATVYIARKDNVKLLSDTIHKNIVFFCMVGVVSLLLSPIILTGQQTMIALAYVVRFAAYGLLLYTPRLLRTSHQEKIFRALLVSGFITVMVGISQYFFFPDLRGLMYLGWDDHYFRLFGSFLDSNFSGAFFVLVAFVSAYYFVITPQSHARTRYLLGAAGIGSIIATLLTYSRSSYLMLIVSALVFGLMRKSKRLAFIIIGLFMVGIVLIPKNLPTEGVDLFRTSSIHARLGEYNEAVHIFKDHPVLGVGFNAYRYAQYSYGFLEQSMWSSAHSGAGVPNSYIFVLATTGIVGMLVYINLWRNILMQLLKRNEAAYIVAPIVGLGVHALFENTLFYPFIMAWMFLHIGYVLAQKEQKKSSLR